MLRCNDIVTEELLALLVASDTIECAPWYCVAQQAAGGPADGATACGPARLRQLNKLDLKMYDDGGVNSWLR